MEPRRVSSRLRDIASRIDASRRPSRALVASELRKLIVAMMPAPSTLGDYEGMMFSGPGGGYVTFFVDPGSGGLMTASFPTWDEAVSFMGEGSVGGMEDPQAFATAIDPAAADAQAARMTLVERW